jgi:hypothetical protein
MRSRFPVLFRWLLRALPLLAIAAAPFTPMTGCQYPSAPPPETSTNSSMGDEAEARAARLNVTQVAYRSRYTDQYGLSYRPVKNHRFVWVYAKVTNITGRALLVGPTDFRLETETAYFEAETLNQPRGRTMFGSAELQPGQSEQGWLLFHILKAPGYSLRFVPDASPLSDFQSGGETRAIAVPRAESR